MTGVRRCSKAEYEVEDLDFTVSENELMGLALDQARQAEEEGEVPAGALVVNPAGEPVGWGRNQVISLSDPTAHAEILALRQAAARAGNYRLVGHRLFSTLEPCPMCLMAAIHARLELIVFGAPEPRWGAAGSLLDMTTLNGLNHSLQIKGGLMAEEARGLITSFFQKRRQGVSRAGRPEKGPQPH